MKKRLRKSLASETLTGAAVWTAGCSRLIPRRFFRSGDGSNKIHVIWKRLSWVVTYAIALIRAKDQAWSVGLPNRNQQKNLQLVSSLKMNWPANRAHVDTRTKRESSPSLREERARGLGGGAALKHTKGVTIAPLPNPRPIRSSWGEGTRLQHPLVRVKSCSPAKPQ